MYKDSAGSEAVKYSKSNFGSPEGFFFFLMSKTLVHSLRAQG